VRGASELHLKVTIIAIYFEVSYRVFFLWTSVVGYCLSLIANRLSILSDFDFEIEALLSFLLCILFALLLWWPFVLRLCLIVLSSLTTFVIAFVLESYRQASKWNCKRQANKTIMCIKSVIIWFLLIFFYFWFGFIIPIDMYTYHIIDLLEHHTYTNDETALKENRKTGKIDRKRRQFIAPHITYIDLSL